MTVLPLPGMRGVDGRYDGYLISEIGSGQFVLG
jgi:hypothetical protein